MKLSLLLFAIAARLRFSWLTSRSFRRLSRLEDFVLTIRTADGTRARSFHFRRGWFWSRRGTSGRADTQLAWCDADTAVRALLSKNELEVYSAIGSSRLRILGNFKYALLFMKLAG